MSDTVTVKLAHALQVGDQMVDKVTVRRPKVKDLRAMDRARSPDGGEMEQGIVMLSILCDLPMEAVNEMDAADFASVSEVLGNFLPQALAPNGGAAS